MRSPGLQVHCGGASGGSAACTIVDEYAINARTGVWSSSNAARGLKCCNRCRVYICFYHVMLSMLCENWTSCKLKGWLGTPPHPTVWYKTGMVCAQHCMYTALQYYLAILIARTLSVCCV